MNDTRLQFEIVCKQERSNVQQSRLTLGKFVFKSS